MELKFLGNFSCEIEVCNFTNFKIFGNFSHEIEFFSTIFFFSISEPAATLKKLKIHIETLHSTKLKEEKASKAKGGKGGKRSTVKMDLSKDILGGGGAGGGYDDDFDDFM